MRTSDESERPEFAGGLTIGQVVAPPTKTKVICTVGPRSLKPKIIRGLEELGVSLFRINLSHTPIDKVAPAIAFLQQHSDVPVCLDSEGAQIRTGTFKAATTNLTKGSLVQIPVSYTHLGFRRETSAPGQVANPS